MGALVGYFLEGGDKEGDLSLDPSDKAKKSAQQRARAFSS